MNWLILLALRKGVEAEEPLNDKVGIEEDFLFNFLSRDQKSLEDIRNETFSLHFEETKKINLLYGLTV